MKIGDKVKMTRRPYFSGRIAAAQLSFAHDEIKYFCGRHFKPENWISKTPMTNVDLCVVNGEGQC